MRIISYLKLMILNIEQNNIYLYLSLFNFMKFLKISLILIYLSGCSNVNQGFVPKPKGYQRIDLPEHVFQPLIGTFPYTFEYSKFAEVLVDKSPDSEPYWIIVNYPTLNAKIQFTYKPLNGDMRKLDKHVADAYKLAAKHQVKATAQTEYQLQLKNGKKVIVIELEGEVPSHYQFYATDTSKHYLRGAVYLNNATLNDSLSPIVEFMKLETRHLIETLKWKN